MNLLEALQLANQSRTADGKHFRLALHCGFTPLHLETFLAAHLASQTGAPGVSVSHGLYGDLAGNLERFERSQADASAVVIEWADLDARLGPRGTGGWEPERLVDILRCVSLQLQRIGRALESHAPLPAVVSLPTLPLLPVSFARPAQLSSFEADLRSRVASFAVSLTAHPHLRLLSSPEIDRQSPLGQRFDLKGELSSGFPYSLAHTDEMARLIAGLVRPPARKKGLITDLDDTLWGGILGEVGVAGISWRVEDRAQIHALYQQCLASLAASGTLVGVASKNDPELVGDALGRSDILLSQDRIFPIEAHWGAKSLSVARILKAWNISPDDVVFVDDSPIELAEVQAAFPSVECIRFPGATPARFLDFLGLLRDRFGTTQVQREDVLRADSLRSRAQFESEVLSNVVDADTFLQHADAEMTFSCSKQADARAFELLNKTNQFNLNGERLSESEWNSLLASDHSFVLKVSYKDRFGPLGMIAVLGGTWGPGSVTIEHWVMSCRAFSRRIEHRCLDWVFDHFDVEEVALRFVPTPRNGPLQEFLGTLVDPLPLESLSIPHAVFSEKCPALYHSVQEESDGFARKPAR
jgi:FkbH-like protein